MSGKTQNKQTILVAGGFLVGTLLYFFTKSRTTRPQEESREKSTEKSTKSNDWVDTWEDRDYGGTYGDRGYGYYSSSSSNSS